MSAAPGDRPVAILEREVVASTSEEAMRLAAQGERGPLYIRADRQTAGRGRSGRSWATGEGNLAISRLGLLAGPPAEAAQLSLVAGVALHRALSRMSPPEVAQALRVKWPNDVMAGGAKLAGVLIETSTFAGDRVAVIGVGVNLVHAPPIEGRQTASLAALAGGAGVPSAAEAGRVLAEELEAVLVSWDEGRGFSLIREEWLARALAVGTPMSVNAGHGAALVTGAFAGLDPGGALLLDVAGEGLRTITAGDVELPARD